MGRIFIGTSGYSYGEWVGPVYPQGTGQEEFLGLYGKRFPTVELNFSYYTMPRPSGLSKMLDDGGPDLRFSIKAHESLTHKIDPLRWGESAAAFLRAIDPLRQTGRLEAVLFQFPFSFHYKPENRLYLDKLLGEFTGIPSAVEFRNGDWYKDRVIEGLRKRGAALVSLDMPALEGLPPETEEVTASFAYIRFHGKNSGAWWGGNSASRYKYRYSDSELEAAGERIIRIAAKADKVLVYFNNHPLGYAALNAEMLQKILEPGNLNGGELQGALV